MTASRTLVPAPAAEARPRVAESAADGSRGVDAAELTARQRASIFPCVKPLYDEPLVLVEAEGVRARGADGREYLDLFAGILTTSIGHCHPRIVEAVRDQVARLGHTSNLYVTEPYVAAAERLTGLAPAGLDQVMFTNSGTEAIETAVMLAQMHTRRSEIIGLRLGYSGRSTLATSLTGQAQWKPLPATAPIRHAIAPYPYRHADGHNVDRYIDELVEVIETTTTGRPAALLAETIQGVGGYIVPPPEYHTRAAEVIRAYGGVFICDEVQAGFGRTGGRWFGIEHWDVEPDIMVVAKGVANGFPVGGTLAREEIAAAWTGLTFSTYGGSPVSMVAARATMDVMVEENTPARSAARGRQMHEGLEALQRDYPWIGDVRGMGLMIAMELVEDPVTKEPGARLGKALLEAAREEGVLIGLGGMGGHVIRIGPSMLITREEVAEALERLGRACARVEAGRKTPADQPIPGRRSPPQPAPPLLHNQFAEHAPHRRTGRASDRTPRPPAAPGECPPATGACPAERPPGPWLHTSRPHLPVRRRPGSRLPRSRARPPRRCRSPRTNPTGAGPGDARGTQAAFPRASAP